MISIPLSGFRLVFDQQSVAQLISNDELSRAPLGTRKVSRLGVARDSDSHAARGPLRRRSRI